MTTVTASTSVILVDTYSGLSPHIVYFPYISTVGRIITVRDNDGYASTGNTIILSTVTGAYFPENQSTLTINQPFGFITLSSELNGRYSILNTFAFPTGSASAYVYTLNTNKLAIIDNTTSNFLNITVSTGTLYYGSNSVGNVTNDVLNSNIAYIDNKITATINSSLIVRRYVAVGNSGTPDVATGSIQFSDNITVWNNALNGTQGFSNGGIDIVNNDKDFYVACGNNYSTTSQNNLGYLQWSTDGIVWNNSISPVLSLTTIRSKVFYANGLWHAVGKGTDSNAILWSSDGKTWSPSYNSQYTFDSDGFNSITYGRNIWVAGGSNLNHPAYSMIYSRDGSNWNPNPTVNTILGPFYDITFTGYTFVALAGNSQFGGNIVVSVSGSNDSVIIPVGFINEPGYVATNGIIVLAVTQSRQRYSLDFGYTWSLMPDFPIGTPGRPYYDGSLWWVCMNNGLSSGMFYSTSGSNLWTTSNLSGVFPSGYPQTINSLNVSSNLNLQLLSTVAGLEASFKTSSLQIGTISAGSFNIFNSSNTDGDILNISSFNNNAFVSINNLSTNNIYTNIIHTNSIDIAVFNTSTINMSTLFVSDTISSSSITSKYINVDSLNISSIITSTIYINNLSTNNINVSSISSGIIGVDALKSRIVYSDIISTNIAVISTVNLIDNTTGNITDLNAKNDELYFQGKKLLTTAGTNPLYFTYQLQDTTSSPPGATGFFTVNSTNLLTTTVINFSVTDYNNIALIGLFNRVGIYSILHIINNITLDDSIYLITNITESPDLSYYTFNLLHLVGKTRILNVGPPGDIYNFYIGNIGIKPPPSSPTDTVIVNAGILGTAFNFNSAFYRVPANIGTYSGGSVGFTISLNNLDYNLGNIPATVGSIVYYNGTNYISVNVKYSSLNSATGAYITINGGLNHLTVGGLTLANFPASLDNNPSGPYAIYITIKFLN